MVCRLGLGALPADAAGQLDVLGHNGDSLGVNCAQVSVLKEPDQVSLTCFLQGHDGRALETQIGFEVLSDLPHQALEGKFADEQLGGFLVAPDLPQSHGAGPVAMRLLHSAGGRSALPRRFGRQLFARSFSTSRFARCLLGPGHSASVARTRAEMQEQDSRNPLQDSILYCREGPSHRL